MSQKTTEDITKDINSIIDKYEEKEVMMNEEDVAEIRKEIEKYLYDAIEAGLIKQRTTVDIDVDEVQGYMDIYIGEIDEESKDPVQDSKECEQATQTSGESLKRVIK